MFYPEIHKFDTKTHKAKITMSEKAYPNSILELIDDQIQIVGGCCGVNDKHLKRLIQSISE